MLKPKFLANCCHYPSTVIMLDDDVDLLKNLSMSISPFYKSKVSSSPREVIRILKTQGNTLEDFVKRHVSIPVEEFDIAKTFVSIDILSLQQEIYRNPIRFGEHLVLVIDYAMPEMNGLEVCHKIRSELGLPVKILMLTGEADQSTAIQAFNDKLIDRFLVKNDPDYMKKMLFYIEELHIEYFKDLSNMTIETARTGEKNARTDTIFLQFFNDLINQLKIVEFYLIEEPASYLLLDANKNVNRLVLKTEEDMQMLYELASEDPDTPTMVVEALRKREKLVFFHNEKSKVVSPKFWMLEDATSIHSKEIYYCSIIPGARYYPLKEDKIISYEQFLND